MNVKSKNKSLFKIVLFSIKKFKLRGKLRIKGDVLSNGNVGIISNKNQNLETRHLYMLKIRMKKLFKQKFRKEIKKKFIKIWFAIRLNKILTKKAKNARMGKGVGKFIRNYILLFLNSSMFEFSGAILYFVSHITKFLFRRFNIRSKLITNNEKSLTL